MHTRATGPAPNGRPVVWSCPLLSRIGYAEDARNLILGLDRAGVDVRADPMHWGGWQARLSSGAAERLEHLLAIDAPDRFVHVVHFTPETFRRHPRATMAVGRTLFETDSLPSHWVPACNRMDEIWVPSDFNLETFARAGVTPEKLHKIPGAISADLYESMLPPLDVEDLTGFVFLCVLAWGRRKGWDVLVRAYVEEFDREEEVVLALKVDPPFGRTVSACRDELEDFVRRELSRDLAAGPRIATLELDLSTEDMARLYKAADAYVMPSRGEGWGRPYMEAMAAGLPTIGTRWSGNLEFMNDENSYLVDCALVDVPEVAWQEVPGFKGQRWAEPSLEHLRSLMRSVFENHEEAADKGARARTDILGGFGWEQAAAAVVERLQASGTRPTAIPRLRKTAPAVTWEGDVFAEHSLAIVNRELCRALVGSQRVDLSLACDSPDHSVSPFDPALASLEALAQRSSGRPPDVHVRHAWPPSFEPPDSGRWVIVQPWELGSLPRSWIEPLNRLVDEVWVPSRYVRDCYLRSGVDRSKLAVVPNGVNPLRFHPGAPPLALFTERTFRFLFVGGTIPRKGADILVETYLRTFSPQEDVCLVVKDFGTDSFYRGQGLRDEIRRLQDDPRNPEILYIDADLPYELMAGLYRACHCLVQPYRGEGFCLPVAEAMSCGLPAIVTAHGACLDFCDPSVAYLVSAREVSFSEPRVGGLETVDRPWWAEVDRELLARAMRRAFEERQEAQALGRRASARILQNFTWRHSAAAAAGRLEALAGGLPLRSRPSTVGRRAKANRKGLSVCMIVRDEQELLARCLESVRGLADQVVVVDTGSTDRTVYIAQGLGAEVHRFPWVDDFGAARNESLRHARHEWVLVLDADETLDPASHGEIRRLVQTDEPAGYMLRTFNYTDREGSASLIEHHNLRLFPNHPDLRYVGRDPHAQVRPRRPDLQFPILPCDAIIHHEGYRPQIADARQKYERNRMLLELAVREEPGEPFHAYNLGVTYNVLGRSADGERELLRAIALGLPQLRDGTYPHYLVNAYVSLALATLRQERPGESAAYCERALELAPDLPDAYVTLGAARARLGHFDAAIRAYEQALTCRTRTGLQATDRATSEWKPFLGMGEVYLLQGRWADALACLERAHASSPRGPVISVPLAKALLGLGRAAEAEETLREAAVAEDAPAETWLLLADLVLERRSPEEAAGALREGLFRYPEEEAFYERLAALDTRSSRDSRRGS